MVVVVVVVERVIGGKEGMVKMGVSGLGCDERKKIGWDEKMDCLNGLGVGCMD